MRGKISIIRDTGKESIEEKIMSDPKIKEHITGRVIKQIYIPNKLYNIVTQK